MVQAGLYLVELKWVESETCATRLNGLDDLVDVVANDAWRSVTERCGGTVSEARIVAARAHALTEADVACVLLDD